MGVLFDFVLGAAAIVAPGNKLVLLGVAVAQGGRALARHTRERRDARNGGAAGGAGPDAAAPIELTWTDVRVSVAGKEGRKEILRGVSGAARPGRLLAIMGPSGGGKTTLLNVLARQLGKAKGLSATGEVRATTAGGAPAPRGSQAYVEQDDAFYSMLTVRETVALAARLHAAPGTPDEQVDAEAGALVRRLGLAKVEGSRVGGGRARGLSGGERKRLAIACALVGGPRVLFADEPTTGLDSFQAEKVVAALKDLAADGCTVVCSIHQPRSSVFAMFDDLVLLSEGSCVYEGPAEGALPLFASAGHACPEHYNPAEFLADLISIDHTSPEAEAESRERVGALLAEAVGGASGMGSAGRPGGPPRFGPAPPDAPPTVHASIWAQLRLLATRSWRQVTRDRATNVARAASSLSSALIFGSIFFRMGRGQASVQDRMGLLQVAAINAAMSSLVKTLAVFPKERVIVQRERAKGGYGAGPYFLAKLAAEAPVSAAFPLLFGAAVYPATGLNPSLVRFAKFLGVLTLESFTAASLGLAVGAAAPSADAAAALGPAVMVVFIVFGGYYVNPKSVPRPLRWLPRASLIKHAFEGLAVTEFRGLQFEGGGEPGDVPDGDAVLARLGFAGSTVRSSMRAQAKVMAFFCWATLCLLRARSPAFVAVGPAGGEGGDGGGSAPADTAAAGGWDSGDEAWVEAGVKAEGVPALGAPDPATRAVEA